LKDIIEEEIFRFVKGYKAPKELPRIWEDPLVAFADAGDPLFLELKDLIAPSHALPSEILEGAETVIVYFLPFHKSIPKANRRGLQAAREWALAYIRTNQLIIDINDHLTEVLKKRGFDAAPLPPTHNFDKKRLMSDWSHKHVAYIAGLGKFGLHHLLITEKGCCGRLGSLVTNAPINATRRPDGENCLYKSGKPCQVCVQKCVNGALKSDGLDRHRCYKVLLENEALYEEEGVADVCGKCTCIVPCSFHNPVRKLPAP